MALRLFHLALARKLTLAALALGASFGLSERVFACSAEPLVKGIATTFEQAARSGSDRAFSSAVAHYADMRSLALFALGPYRSQLTARDERRYVTLARGFLGRWMAQNSSRLNGTGIAILSCSPSVVVARFGNSTTVQFRLANARRVSDITVSGVSLAGVLRTKFTDVMRENNGDMGALMNYLEG